MPNRKLVWLMSLPVIAQVGAVAVQLRGGAPYGLYAQVVALLVMIIVYGALGISRFRFLRRNYKDIKRRRDENAAAFRSVVDEHLPPTARR